MTLSTIGQVKEHRQPTDVTNTSDLARADDPGIISTLIPVALAFMAIGLYGVPIPGAGVPASTAVLGVAAILSLFARPTVGLHRSHLLVIILVLIPGWLAVSTALNHLSPVKRLTSLAVWMLIALVLGSGRLCRISAARGIAIGLTLAVLWGIARIPVSSYTDRLSGSFGEPNSAGMVLCVAGFAALAHLSTKRAKLLLLAVLLTGVVFSFSRTSYLAVAVMVAWIILSRYVKPQLLLAATVIGIYVISRLPETSFATDQFAGRSGSDALRGRIAAAEHVSVSIHPLYGNGAGTSQVKVQDGTFFFHNSYLGLRAEGGYIALGILLVFGAALLLALISLPKTRRNLWLEASLLGVALCALNLGNVLLTTPAAIAIGMSLRHLAVEHRKMRDELEDDAEPHLKDDHTDTVLDQPAVAVR